jgi:hypothetical protein
VALTQIECVKDYWSRIKVRLGEHIFVSALTCSSVPAINFGNL